MAEATAVRRLRTKTQSSQVQDLAGLAGFVQDVINAIGPIGVAVLVFIESVFPPIPSEVVLPSAGFIASINGDSPVVYIIAATIGSVTGSWLHYGMGRSLGERRTKAILCALPLFTLYTALGSLIWTTVLIMAGY